MRTNSLLVLLTVNTEVPARALATWDGFKVVVEAPEEGLGDCETEANGDGEKRRLVKDSARRLVSSKREERSEAKRLQWW